MSAATAPRKTMQMEGNPLPVVLSFPIKANAILYQGTLAMIDSSGRLIAGAAATGCQTVGKFDNNEAVTDATGFSDGDKIGTVYPGVWKWANGTGGDVIAADDVGKLAYVIDNQTVGLTDGSATRSIAGTIFGVDSSGNVYVYSNLSAPVDGTALAAEAAARLAFEAALALTTTPGGASLVGLYDVATLYTATTVEAALAEVMKKANAGLGNPISIPIKLVAHATGSIAARLTPGFAGKIRKITAYVKDPVTTAAKLATFTAAIAGTPTTGGALALTSANCTPVGAKIDGSAITAANAFSAVQEITLVSSAVTAFVEGEVVALLFLDPA